MISAETRRIAIRLAAAVLLLATPALAAREPAPTVSPDPETNSVVVSGAHHPHKPALNLIRTDWWLRGEIVGGMAGDPVLMVGVDLPGWAALDSASDASGTKLAVTVIAREPSPVLHGENEERVAVALPRALADRAAGTGLAVTVSGKARSFPILVPGDTLRSFLAGYDAAVATAKTAPQPIAEAKMPPAIASPPSVAPPPVPIPAATQEAPVATRPVDPPPAAAAAPAESRVAGAASSADTTPTIASLGIQIVATSSGAMVLAVTPGSKASSIGITSGDFIEGVDGASIKGLSIDAMVARIGAPGTRTLDCIAAGTVKLR